MQHLDEIQRGNHITVGHNKKAAVTIKEQTKGRKQTANTMQKCWHVKYEKQCVMCRMFIKEGLKQPHVLN